VLLSNVRNNDSKISVYSVNHSNRYLQRLANLFFVQNNNTRVRRHRCRRHRGLRGGRPEPRTIHAVVRSPVSSHIGVDQRQPERHHRHGPRGFEDIFLRHSTACRTRGLRRDGQSNVREQGTALRFARAARRFGITR